MSIQTTSLVNGQWTTRNVDIHHVVAQNREDRQRHKSKSTTDVHERPPIRGVLSQTLVKSPVIKWIIPARMRHKSKNDVVFVYENYIEVREVQSTVLKSENDGRNPQYEEFAEEFENVEAVHKVTMQKVAMKADFDSMIRSAKIIGSPRRYISPQRKRGNHSSKHQSLEENEKNLSPGLPPHILVLSLASKTLVFLFAYHDSPSQIRFVLRKRPLPSQRSSAAQLGDHVAVDPKSRAMAVAAYEGSFVLYALKPMDEIRRGIEGVGTIHASRFEPVRGERHIQVEGVIVKMDFLHPPEGRGNEDRVILLLVLSKDRQSRLMCYEWDCSTDLTNASQMVGGQRICSDERLPLLLVPLTKSTAFMLVSEKRITIYRDILTGNATTHTLPLRVEEPPERFLVGASRRSPIWTQWARPSRHDPHVQKHDNIYLCRDDGVICFLQIKDSVAQMVDSIHQVDNLGVNIDTSFASIDLGAYGADLLVVGGDESDGGGWLFEPRQHANKKLVIPNWTAVTDFTSAESSRIGAGHPLANFRTGRDLNRLFASTGRDLRHGGITEIRCGIEASLEITLNLPQDISQLGITQIWALDDVSGNGVLMLLSHPAHTSLWHMNSEGAIVDFTESDELRLDFHARTMAAGVTADGLIIQVTERSIICALSQPNAEPFYQKADISAACVQICEDEHPSAVLLMVLRQENGLHLHLGRFESDGLLITYRPMGSPKPLMSEPSFITLKQIGDTYLAFIGTLEAIIQIYRGSSTSGLSFAYTYSFEGQVAICDSVAILEGSAGLGSEALLVCGLRNGSIEILRMDLERSNDSSIAQYQKLRIGNTSVMVSADNSKSSRVLILCEQKLHILELPRTHSTYDRALITINSIWLTDFERLSFQHGKIDAFAQASSGFAQSWLFCVDGKHIYLASLSSEAESCMVPRRLTIEGTPQRVMYSARLDKLVVLYYKDQFMPTDGRHVGANQRFLQYAVTFVDPNDDPIKPDPDEDDATLSTVSQGRPGEVFLGSTEWFPEGSNGVHHMLVINTGTTHMPPQQPLGRILVFSISNAGVLTLKSTIEKQAPVQALVPYSSSSLLYCCGLELCLQTLDSSPSYASGRKWQEPFKFTLRAPGRRLSVVEGFIYISSGNSLSIFTFENNTFVPQFNDEVARDNLCHLNLPEHSLILSSQTSKMIAGLWQPPKKRINNSTSTLFEANLPASVTSFCRVKRPLWQRDFGHGVASDTIIGCSINGSLFQFDILDEASWRLLIFIQNLALRNPEVCPSLDAIVAHKRSLDPSPADPLNMHVNGDILRRLLERAAERSLGRMLSPEHIADVLLSQEHIFHVMSAQQPGLDLDGVDLENPHARATVIREVAQREAALRRNLFHEVAAGVGLTKSEEGEGCMRDDGEVLEQKVMHWMAYRLRKVM